MPERRFRVPAINVQRPHGPFDARASSPVFKQRTCDGPVVHVMPVYWRRGLNPSAAGPLCRWILAPSSPNRSRTGSGISFFFFWLFSIFCCVLFCSKNFLWTVFFSVVSPVFAAGCPVFGQDRGACCIKSSKREKRIFTFFGEWLPLVKTRTPNFRRKGGKRGNHFRVNEPLRAVLGCLQPNPSANLAGFGRSLPN